MDPLSNNDPLHTLLGKARPVEPRTDFTQNVMRAIRQVPQSQGLWVRVQEWFGSLSMPRLALAGAAALAVVLTVIALQQPVEQVPVVVEETVPVPAAAAQPHLPAVVDEMLLSATETPVVTSAAVPPDFGDMDPMGILLVQEDTSALTNSEIALLLY